EVVVPGSPFVSMSDRDKLVELEAKKKMVPPNGELKKIERSIKTIENRKRTRFGERLEERVGHRTENTNLVTRYPYDPSDRPLKRPRLTKEQETANSEVPKDDTSSK